MAFLFGKKKTPEKQPRAREESNFLEDRKEIGLEAFLAFNLTLLSEAEHGVIGLYGSDEQRSDQANMLAVQLLNKLGGDDVQRLADLSGTAPSAFVGAVTLIRQNKVRMSDLAAWDPAELDEATRGAAVQDRPAALLAALRAGPSPKKLRSPSPGPSPLSAQRGQFLRPGTPEAAAAAARAPSPRPGTPEAAAAAARAPSPRLGTPEAAAAAARSPSPRPATPEAAPYGYDTYENGAASGALEARVAAALDQDGVSRTGPSFAFRRSSPGGSHGEADGGYEEEEHEQHHAGEEHHFEPGSELQDAQYGYGDAAQPRVSDNYGAAAAAQSGSPRAIERGASSSLGRQASLSRQASLAGQAPAPLMSRQSSVRPSPLSRQASGRADGASASAAALSSFGSYDSGDAGDGGGPGSPYSPVGGRASPGLTRVGTRSPRGSDGAPPGASDSDRHAQASFELPSRHSHALDSGSGHYSEPSASGSSPRQSNAGGLPPVPEGGTPRGPDGVSPAIQARINARLVRRTESLKGMSELAVASYVGRASEGAPPFPGEASTSGAGGSGSGSGAAKAAEPLDPNSSSAVLVHQLQQDISLISRLPVELQRRSTRAQMLELVQWMRQAPEGALGPFWRWVNSMQIPVAIILAIPPERIASTTDFADNAFDDVLSQFRGLPTSLVLRCATVEELQLLRTWKQVNARGLEAFELSLAMSSDPAQRFTATTGLPRSFVYAVFQRSQLDWCLEWFYANKDVMVTAANLIGPFRFEDLYAVPSLILHHAPTVDAVKLLCTMISHKASGTVRNISSILYNELRGAAAPIKLFLADLVKIPVELLMQSDTTDQILSLGRLAECLSQSYISMDKLSPENTWRRITAGEFGSLYEASYCGVPVALKLPHKVDDWLELSASEIAALLHVPPHPCITQLYGITVKLQRGELELMLVMEYVARGNANQFLDEGGENSKWTLEDRYLLCYTIGQGLEHLHSLKPPIIHRDLKPDNILLRERPQRKKPQGKNQEAPPPQGTFIGVITDFGLARLRHGKAIGTIVAGTDRFMAPEAFTSNKVGGIDELSDVFCYGTLIWSLLTGKDPFDQRLQGIEEAKASFMAVYKILVEENKRPDDFEPWPRHIPLEVIKIVRSCWGLDPRNRPNFPVINQQWLAFFRRNNLLSL